MCDDPQISQGCNIPQQEASILFQNAMDLFKHSYVLLGWNIRHGEKGGTNGKGLGKKVQIGRIYHNSARLISYRLRTSTLMFCNFYYSFEIKSLFYR